MNRVLEIGTWKAKSLFAAGKIHKIVNQKALDLLRNYAIDINVFQIYTATMKKPDNKI